MPSTWASHTFKDEMLKGSVMDKEFMHPKAAPVATISYHIT